MEIDIDVIQKLRIGMLLRLNKFNLVALVAVGLRIIKYFYTTKLSINT